MIRRLVLAAFVLAGCRSSSTTKCLDPKDESPHCQAAAAEVAKGSDALPSPATPGSPADTKAPTPGTALVFSAATDTSVTVSWGPASDDVTPVEKLEYLLARANDIDLMGDLKTNLAKVEIVRDWTPASVTFPNAPLTAGATTHFGVLVRDAAGNVAAYEPKTPSPNEAAPSETPTPVPTSTTAPAPALAITAPSGGTVTSFKPYAITWTSTSIAAAETIAIAFTTNDGASWTTIAAAAPNSGTYEWSVASPFAPAAKVRLQLVSDPSVESVSATFKIASELPP